MSRSETQQTLSSAGIISASAFGGAIAGFVLQLLVAYYFGAGSETDAFFMAQSTSEMLSKLLLGGSITAVFLPMFVERITQGRRDEAWNLGLNILHLTALIFIVLIGLIGLFAEPFVHFIAPGFDTATSEQTISLLRVLLPSFLFLFLVELVTSMLHSVKHFLTPALLRIVAPLTSVVVIVLLVQQLGIYALALGVLIGSLLQLALVAWALSRHGFSYRFVLQPFDPAIKRLLYLVYPFIYSVVVTQGAGIVYRILVSDLDAGSLSSLKFAEKITQLLTIMFLNSVTFVVFPLLSEKASGKDYVGMRETIGSALRLITFVTVPLMVGVALLREPLIALIYQRGSFTAEDAGLTSIALLFLVLGLTTNGIGSVFGHAVLALQKTRASVVVTIASQAVAISLFVLLVPPMGHAGLALASSLVPLAIALLYGLYLTRFIKKLGSVFWHPTFGKTIVLAALLAAAVAYTLPLAAAIAAPRQASLILQLLLPTVTGCLVFFGGAWLWQVPEMHDVLNLVRSKIKK